MGVWGSKGVLVSAMVAPGRRFIKGGIVAERLAALARLVAFT